MTLTLTVLTFILYLILIKIISPFSVLIFTHLYLFSPIYGFQKSRILVVGVIVNHTNPCTCPSLPLLRTFIRVQRPVPFTHPSSRQVIRTLCPKNKRKKKKVPPLILVNTLLLKSTVLQQR